MSTAAMERLKIGALGIFALRGWVVGVLAGVVPAALLYAVPGLLMQPLVSIGDWARLLGNFLIALVGLALLGGFHALPAPILAIAFLWVAERISRHTRKLPFWLAVGVVASLPTAAYIWLGVAAVAAHDQGTLELDPFAWSNLQLPLLVLACGLVGAHAGWRAQVRRSR